MGRTPERELLRERLTDGHQRLTTLTGPGGTGKTRLALAVAADLAATFPDGVWFVDLSSTLDPALVASDIAQTLGIKEASDRPLLECLVEALRDRHLLIVLDNFEQVVGAAGQVGRLLESCAANLQLQIARDLEDRWGQAIALAGLGKVALDRSDLVHARDQCRAALQLFAAVDDKAGLVRGLVVLGLTAERAGQPLYAAKLLAAAEGLRERLGFVLADGERTWIDACSEQLVRLLGSPQLSTTWQAAHKLELADAVKLALEPVPEIKRVDAPRGGLVALTRREQEVAALIAEGLTDRQIAERLVITEGTAGLHVMHILSKLGFNSRVQVAAWYTRQGRPPS